MVHLPYLHSQEAHTLGPRDLGALLSVGVKFTLKAGIDLILWFQCNSFPSIVLLWLYMSDLGKLDVGEELQYLPEHCLPLLAGSLQYPLQLPGF